MRPKAILILLSLLFLFSNSSYTFFSKEIQIQAKILKAERNKYIYENNVIVTIPPDKVLKCDKLIIQTMPKHQEQKIKQIKAIGHVLYKDKNYQITANEMIYNPPDTVICLGNVVIKDNKNLAKGDKAIYNLKDKKFEIKSESKNKVVSIINPS